MPGRNVSDTLAERGRFLTEMQDGVQEVESWGCVIKDLDRGLVDFLARRGREQVYLCWHLGEAEICCWHGLQEGFRGRKPLDETFLG